MPVMGAPPVAHHCCPSERVVSIQLCVGFPAGDVQGVFFDDVSLTRRGERRYKGLSPHSR